MKAKPSKKTSSSGIMSLDLKGNSLKGVYNLNPTKMIMKQGSKAERKALTSNTKSNTKPAKAKGK